MPDFGFPSTFKHQELKLRNIADTFTLTVRNPAITADKDHVFGKIPYGFIFIDSADSNLIKYVNGSTGGIDSSNADPTTTIQYALDNIGSGGGAIVQRQGTCTTTAPLTFALTNAKFTHYQGTGYATKILLNTGTGNLLTLTGTSSSLQYFRLSNIQLAGGTSVVTSNRHGIDLGQNGPTSYMDYVWLRYFDIALNITNTNTLAFDKIKIQNANTGIKTDTGADTVPNLIQFNDCFIAGCANEGVHINAGGGGGAVVGFNGGSVSESGTGIKISGSPRDVVIGPNPVYMEGNTVVDVHVAGTSSVVYPRNVSIKNLRATGQVGTLASMIKVDYCDNLLIENCTAYQYSSSMILLNQDFPYNLMIVNPLLDGGSVTPYLLDASSGGLLTTGRNRLAGSVIEPARRGTIVNIESTGLVAGDVVILSGNASYATTTTADSPNPGVIMYPNAGANKPGVIVSNGRAYVNVDGAAAAGDTLTTSGTTKKAKVNNSATDPKIVIGYASETTGGAGLCLARIGW